jgi:N-acetylglutamate synthase-like GNAT family acetyltransferase
VYISFYQPQYQTQVIGLILHIQRQEFGLPITLEDQPDLLNISKVYQQGNGNFWIAVENDQVIGTIAAIDIQNHQLALRKLFVTSAYRATNWEPLEVSIGQQLLNTLRHWATERNIKDIYLGTVSTFKAAHRFYQKNGFQRIDRADLPHTFPSMSGDTHFYRLIMRQS